MSQSVSHMSSHIPSQIVVEDRSTRNTDHKTSCWSCSFANYAAERIIILGIGRTGSSNTVVVRVWHNLVKSNAIQPDISDSESQSVSK